MALTANTIETVKATAPVLKAHGLAIVTRMYERLLADPDLARLFDPGAQRSGEQAQKVAGAILAFAEHVDRLEALTPALERIAARHVGAGVEPGHYLAVADNLLGAMSDVLGTLASGDVLTAWAEAYWFLAERLKAMEAAISAQERRAA